MVKHANTWIVVADGARARFFAVRDDAKALTSILPSDMVAPASRQLSRELKSDKPGRSFSSSRSGVRHALEPKHDFHKLEKHRFAASLVEFLDAANERREFDDLILVVPRRSLGELRTLMSKRVQSRIRQEIPRDLTGETTASLWRHLAPFVQPPYGVRRSPTRRMAK